MNKAEDPEPTDGETGGSDAGEAGLPWQLPRDEEEVVDEEIILEEGSEATTLEASEEEPEAATARPEGTLRVWCPGCEQEVNILREHLGMQGECPSCELLIVASMRPDESGAMRVAATEVPVLEEASVVKETDVAVEGDRSVSPSEIPVPSWMKDSLVSKSESEGAVDAAEDGDEKLDEVDSADSEESKAKDEDKSANPSWADGGNPWNALGLKEKEAAESSSEDKDEAKSDDTSKEELASLDNEESGDDEEELEGEAALEEQEESRLGLIVAVVIIFVVGGGGLTAYMMRDSGSTKDKEAIEKVAQTSKATGEKKKGGEKVEKKEPKSTGSNTEKTAGGSSDKPAKSGEDKMKVASKEPKAIKRPEEKGKPAGSSTDKKPDVASSGPKPEMATAQVDVTDDVAVRMHQEGERAIRRFYRARSVEERSAFVLNPGQAMKSMRRFYDKLGNLPTIRYLEFKGKLHDPTSGFRFGVFDVHEKENEESHRWCVVEIEPGQYALDWGFYEQLESSTLIAYLSKAQSSSKKFRFLMKLGDTVSAVDSPWDEAAVQVHLQLPLAGGGGGETILLKKTDAEDFGVIKELADGQMKIGRVKLDWVVSDKDPGSKVPTITELEGWGAWSKPKLRGLN